MLSAGVERVVLCSPPSAADETKGSEGGVRKLCPPELCGHRMETLDVGTTNTAPLLRKRRCELASVPFYLFMYLGQVC